MFKKDYKCADCQLHLLNIVNPNILNYEIFKELTEDDPNVKFEMLKCEYKSQYEGYCDTITFVFKFSYLKKLILI